MLERRPAFVLILVLGNDVERLTEVFLMLALQLAWAFWRRLRQLAVIAFDQQIVDAFHIPDFSLCHVQADGSRQLHAKGFIEHESFKMLDSRFKNVSAWRPAKRD